jgi:peroxiredoxin Q/BCP
MKIPLISAAVLGLLSALAFGAGADAPMPAAGQKAPDFSLLGSDGKAHSLRSHLGRQAVVLAFFPKAFTGG